MKWTDKSLTTDANGTVTLRGFKGDYTITVGDDKAHGSTTLQLTEARKVDVTVSPLSAATTSTKITPLILRKARLWALSAIW